MDDEGDPHPAATPNLIQGLWGVRYQVKDVARSAESARIDDLRGVGFRFRNTMEVGPGGRQIQIEDPDGNPIELFEPAGRPPDARMP